MPPPAPGVHTERRVSILVERTPPPLPAAALPAAAGGRAEKAGRHGGQVDPVALGPPVDPSATRYGHGHQPPLGPPNHRVSDKTDETGSAGGVPSEMSETRG